MSAGPARRIDAAGQKDSLIAESISTIDNLEHLYLPNVAAGDYVVRVTRIGGGGVDELFALAWKGVAVPEPSVTLIARGAIVTLLARQQSRRRDDGD